MPQGMPCKVWGSHRDLRDIVWYLNVFQGDCRDLKDDLTYYLPEGQVWEYLEDYVRDLREYLKDCLNDSLGDYLKDYFRKCLRGCLGTLATAVGLTGLIEGLS